MGFRTVEISKPSEVHIVQGQLEVTQSDKVVTVPVEDIQQITMIGSSIRLSSKDLSMLVNEKITITTLDNSYLPTAIVIPFEGNARQSKVMHAQVALSKKFYGELWLQIIKQKILNQQKCLFLLNIDSSNDLLKTLENLTIRNVDQREAIAAKNYFQSLFNNEYTRDSESPMNAKLNYGYAIVRSTIIRRVVGLGFHPTFGIHHNSQLNAFNLADDLIEPFRPIVDLCAYHLEGKEVRLSKAERKALTQVLHHACLINGKKSSVIYAIEELCYALKRIVLDRNLDKLPLPSILPIELIEEIKE